MPEARKYTGGCHCGNVRYEVTASLDQGYVCNCSLCAKQGWMLTFAPATQFTLLSGENAQTDYQFNKKSIHHLFCSTCGVRSFSRGTHPKTGVETIAVNIRCLDGVDPAAIEVKHVDGKSL